MEQYAEEVKARWGKTEAYKEYEHRGSRNGGEALMALFADLGKLRQLPPESPEVQAGVKAIQDHITERRKKLFSIDKSQKGGKGAIKYYFICFFANGLSGVIAKIHQHFNKINIPSNDYLIWFSICAVSML